MEGFTSNTQNQKKIQSKYKKAYHSTSINCGASASKFSSLLKRYQSQQLHIFQNINKKEIFGKVHTFIKSLIEKPQQIDNINKQLNFKKQSNENSLSDITNSLESQAQKNQNENKIDYIEQDIKNSLKQIQNHERAICRLRNEKKISIMNFEGLSDDSISSWLSLQSIKNLSSVSLPDLKLDLKMIEDIYEAPEPFLINLSVCLMLKFLFYSKMILSSNNACWILAVSTILAYKLYYDEPVEGLVDSFSSILNAQRQQIVDMQIGFLNTIEHRVIIESWQYHLVLSKIILVQCSTST